MLTSLAYVSRSLLTPADRQDALADIVAVAQVRNAALGVTGALVFTGRHFAQVLEGSEAAIGELMASIRRDPRHTEVDVVADGPVAARRFEDWSMAYAGASRYVDRHVAALFKSADPVVRAGAAQALIRLMQEFAVEGGVEAV